MKTRIIKPNEAKPEAPIKYPRLMRHWDGTIVCAVNETDGIVLQWPCSRTISPHVLVGGTKWLSCGYTPMRGKVTIEFDMEDGL